ncbi:hypothetical protein [Catelliglobosispora koreensis]|uniref:hypothetical protein n=1 Tax=Catelliglobosispora koreensis TaxID=129052 RepID=UPI00036BC0D0|nr:hypothetical protein [Catelliglobosispora koreensis]
MTSWLRIDTRIRKIQSGVPWAVWAVLALLFFGALWASYVTSDEWFSDSRYYLAWSYRYLGYSEYDAARLTYDALVNAKGLTTCTFCWPAGFESSFFHGENGAVVAPRMIYPLLSAPFVGLMGPTGMLVIPLLAYAIGATALVALASRLYGRWWGVAAGATIIISAVSLRFATSAMTDSLALMFNTLGLLFLPIARKTRRQDVWWFLALLLLNLFTRQFAITVAVGVALTWLFVAIRDRQPRNQWFPFAAGSVVVTGIVLQVQNLYAASFFDGEALSLLGRYQKVAREIYGIDGIDSVPVVIGGMLRVDYEYLRRLDIFLIALILLTIVAVIWRWRSELSVLLTGMTLATAAMTVIIVDPTFFRYFVPLLPLMILCTLGFLHSLFASGRVRAAGPFGIPRLGWIFLGSAFVLTTYLIWREHVKFGPPRGVLYALGIALFLVVVIKRSGALAGVIAGLAAVFAFTVASGLVSSFVFAAALPPLMVALMCLPGSGFSFSPRLRYLIFVGSLGAAVVLTSRAVSVSAAIVAVWLFSAIKQRSLRNEWAPVAAIAFALSALGAFLAVNPIFGSVAYGRSNLGNMKRTIWLLTVDDAAWDRVFVAIAVVALAVFAVTWRSELTWLAVASTAVAGLTMFFGHPGALTGYFAYAALLVIMAVATHIAGYIRRDLARDAGSETTPPDQPVIAPQRTGTPANA